MKKIIFFTLMLFILSPSVYADCTSDFKEVEKNFKVSYNYNEETDDFTITLINPDYERYAFVHRNRDEVKNANVEFAGKAMKTEIHGHKSTEYVYSIMALYSGCANNTVKEEKITLTKYNPYADSPLCVGNEEFALCKKEYAEEMTEDEFKSRLETYKKSKEDNTNNTSNDTNNNDKSKKTNY